MSNNAANNSIAVIGLACWYPGASNPLQLWENILARRRQFRQIPDCRLPLSDYYHPDPLAPDKTYARRVAVIDGFEFDWAARRIPFATVKATDISHWLALETALAAVSDAGYKRNTITSEQTGVIVGNTLTGEQTRANTLRMRWPYVKKAFIRTARDRGVSDDQIEDLCTTFERHFKSVFPPVTEDTLAGGLSNTIAGRICNYLNLQGGGYTIDGACSSSLLAVVNAADRLIQGDLNLAIAGGVDISLDPFELIGFAKTAALTRGDMTVYDRRGSGFIAGEGCGFVVLKRLKDAQKDKNDIYAILNGWGISSDGGGSGITAPNAKGQTQAISKAYEKAPWDINEINFIEGHGTGTTVGDRTELEGINLAMAAAGDIPTRNCGLTSFKSLVGHTKAASGIGGLIKAVIAVNRRIIPPTAACRLPHPAFDRQAKGLYPVRHGEIEDESKILKAGVSAMGFGGINSHVTLCSADPPSPKFSSDLAEDKLMVSNQDTEIFVLSANTISGLEKQITETMAFSEQISLAEMSDLAASMAKQVDRAHLIRGAVVADTPDVLTQRWDQLLKLLHNNQPANGTSFCLKDANEMVWLSYNMKQPKIGFLFPGQGAQQLNMSTMLTRRFNWAKELIQTANECTAQFSPDINLSQLIYRPLEKAADRKEIDTWFEELTRTEVAQPAICLGSLLWWRWLKELAIEPWAVGGHSLGEVTAFSIAGAFDQKTLLRFSALRGRAMAQTGNKGAMVSLKCDREKAEALMQEISDYLIIANLNSPSQMVLAGEMKAVDMVIQQASAEGILAHRLNVSNAFHSLLAAPAAESIERQKILPGRLENLSCRLFSSTTGKEVARGLKLAAHFAEQLKTQVNFIDMVRCMAESCQLLLEVGPGQVLTSLVKDILPENSIQCFPLASAPEGEMDFNRALCALYAHGADIFWPALYQERLIRPFVAPNERIFIENPCESSPYGTKTALTPMPANMDRLLTDLTHTPEEEFKNYLAARGPFIAQLIQVDMSYNWLDRQQAVLPSSNLAANRKPKSVELKKEKLSPTSPIKIEDVLYDLIQESTGFSKETIPLNSRLLEDLNLDSIKAGDLLAKFSQRMGFSWPGDPNILANASIEEIVAAASKISKKDTISASYLPAEDEHDSTLTLNKAEAERLLIATVAEITGFTTDSLSLEARLTDDLNLDSIKTNDLIARTARALNLELKLEQKDSSPATLGDLLQLLLGSKPLAPAPAIQPPPESALDVILKQAAKITGFKLSSIDPDALIERDLHMGPEMLKELLQSSAVMLGTESQVDLAPLRNRSLRQIAHIYSRIIKKEQIGLLSASQRTPLDLLAYQPDAWVRNFEMVPVITPLPPLPPNWGKRQEDDWQAANVLIMHRQGNGQVAEALSDNLLEQGAKVKTAHFSQDDRITLTEDPSFSHLIAVLPRTETTSQNPFDYLREIIEQLSSLTSVAPAAQAPRPRTTLVYVTFGGGYFGMDGRFAVLNQCGAAAIGATLHLERKDLRVRVVDFSTAIEPRQIAAAALAEIHTAPSYSAVGYDYEMTRRMMQAMLSQPVDYPSRDIVWSSDDVLLVTGGAKGITASCALAVAKATGSKTALIGRSVHPEELPENPAGKEIIKTLGRYSDQGLSAKYFSCDVTDLKSVERTIAAIESQLGPIAGVIHGAGLNVPRPARQVSSPKAFEEISPKVLGALNLFRVLAKKPPKIIVGLSSIIGTTGMPGNAWYGFSNEALEILLQRFNYDHPQTHTLAVAYSIWGEEGMGARMGSVNHLAKMGISAINTQTGVNRFVHLVLNHPPSAKVIVSSRLGGLDTWQLPQSSKEIKGRFLTSLVSSLPGLEAVFRTRLSLASDPYLKDHQFQGSYLFPTVFGLEAMAQASLFVTGKTAFTQIEVEDIRLERPITVDPNNGADILIHATLHEKTASDKSKIVVSAGIIKLGGGVKTDYFSARFIFDDTSHPVETDHIPITKRTALIPATDLYRKTLLFQGKRFQRIETIFSLAQTEAYKGQAVFSTRMIPEKENTALAFNGEVKGGFILGDPFFRDTLLQSAALLVPQDTSLPILIKRLTINSPELNESLPVMARIELSHRVEKDLVYQISAMDENGRIIEKLEDYHLRILTHHEDYPTTDELIDPTQRDLMIINESLAYWSEQFKGQSPLLNLAYRPGIDKLSQDQRQKILLPLVQDTAARLSELGVRLPNQVEIEWLAAEKPVISQMDHHQADISLSHDDRLCVCVVGKGATACHLVPITDRSRQSWRELLGSRNESMIDAMLKINDSLNQAGSRLWAVSKILEKLDAEHHLPVKIETYKQDAVLFKAETSSGEHIILTMRLKLTWGPEKILALTFEQMPSVETDAKSTLAYRRIYGDLGEKRAYDMLADGPQGQMVFVHRRPLTFKPNSQLSRTIYFSNYINWMGEVREASVWPIMSDVREQLSTGKWGSVTNFSHIQILGEASVDDMVETRMWASDNSGPEDSTMTLSYDFRKIGAKGDFHRLAFCRLQTTWVEIVGQGIAKPRPYPPYLKEFLDTMLPRYEAPDLPPKLSEPLKDLIYEKADELIYQAPDAPVVLPLLTEKTFETSLSHANMVGNIYYATYYDWKAQTRDQFFYKLIPEYYQGVGKKGEMICLESRVDHLREAMPFDNILVRMALKTLRRCSMVLQFDFFRLNRDNTRLKLAHGIHKAVWVTRDTNRCPSATAWPEALMRFFKHKITQSRTEQLD